MHRAFPAFWIFQNERGEWGWHFAAQEGEFVAGSSKAYSSQQECLEAVRAMTATTSIAVFAQLDDIETETSRSIEPSPGQSAGEGDPLDLGVAALAQPEQAAEDRSSAAILMRSRANGTNPAIPLSAVRMRMGPARALERK